jgi:hypothetical protein
MVTFTVPTGTAYSRRVLDTTDPSVLAGLKIGDRVDVTRTKAARLAVESRTTVNVEEGSRNRFTISAGSKAASGSSSPAPVHTLSGLPGGHQSLRRHQSHLGR